MKKFIIASALILAVGFSLATTNSFAWGHGTGNGSGHRSAGHGHGHTWNCGTTGHNHSFAGCW